MKRDETPQFSSERAGQLWKDGVDLMDRGKWEEALKVWEELLNLQPNSALVLNKIGVCLAETGDLVKAEDAFKRALAIDPSLPQALSNLGNIELTRRNARAAVDLYQQALKIDPDYAIARKNLSIAYKKLGQIDKSVAELKKAHSIESRTTQSRGYAAPDEKPVPEARAGMISCLVWLLVLVGLVSIVVLLR